MIDELSIDLRKHNAWVESGRKKYLDPRTNCNQTKDGLFIRADHELFSPWGKIILTNERCGRNLDFLAFRLSLYKQLKTKFYKILIPKYIMNSELQPQFYKLMFDGNTIVQQYNRYHLNNPSEKYFLNQLQNKNPAAPFEKVFINEANDSRTSNSFEKLFKRIAEDEIKKHPRLSMYNNDFYLRGIPYDCDPIYKIEAINGKRLPEPELLEPQDYLSFIEINTAWNKHMETYKYELIKNNNY